MNNAIRLIFILLAAVNLPAETAKTFSQDVLPILQAKCINCHQPGEIGPMPLMSYTQVRPWAAAIREAVSSGAMPPWHAEKGAYHFRNDRSLSKEEVATVVAWVDAGCPQGAPVDPHAAGTNPGGWKLGKPDLVVQVPGLQVAKSGTMPYTFLIVDLHLDKDTWVHAAEFRIEQRAVIHHINAFVRPPKSSYLASFPHGKVFVPTVEERGQRFASERVFDRRELLLGYEPGYEPAPWLEDGAKLIKAGSDLVLEIHYNPNGTAVTDHSEVGLYFAKAAPKKRIVAIDTLRDLDLAVPPGSADYRSDASMTLARPVWLLSIQPHMHVRGKSMKVVAESGHEDVLLNVPRYDFNWQTTYAFQQPLLLSAGTRLKSTAVFDNSPNNRFNPAPEKAVRWGDQTTDEMHIAFLELALDSGIDPDTIFIQLPKGIGTQSGNGIR